MEKILALKDAIKEIKAQKFKHCNFETLDGEVLQTYNVANKPVGPKLEDIQRRWKSLPDGIYVINCKDVYGKNHKPFQFFVAKGEVDATGISEKVKNRVILKDNSKKETGGSDHVLSYAEALANVKKISELEHRISLLEKERDEYKRKAEEAEAELAEADTEGLGERSLQWAKDTLPQFMPMLDRYFDIKEKKLNFEQAKFLHDQGYELPGMQRNGRGMNGHAKNGRTRRPDYSQQVPEPDSPQWPDYIDWLTALPDAQFNAHLDAVKAVDEDLYARIEEEVLEEEEGEDNE